MTATGTGRCVSWRCWWVWSWRIDGRFRRDASALVAKVSNIAGSGEFHREFETRSFTNRELKKLAARPGDLFVVKSSGSKKNILSGKTAIVAEGSPVPLIASNFLLLLRPKPELVEPHYLWRVLNSSQSKAFIKTIVGAFTYPNLKWSTYRKHPIPLPPGRAEADCGDPGCGGRLACQATRVTRPARHAAPSHLPRHVR